MGLPSCIGAVARRHVHSSRLTTGRFGGSGTSSSVDRATSLPALTVVVSLLFLTLAPGVAILCFASAILQQSTSRPSSTTQLICALMLTAEGLRAHSIRAYKLQGVTLAVPAPPAATLRQQAQLSNPLPKCSYTCMAALNGTAGIKTRTGSVKRPGQELDRNGSTSAAAATRTPDNGVEEAPIPIPLKYVVQEAVKRWFEDTMLEAQRGDVKQQALLGQMYAEGYGVQKDMKQAKEWSDKATSRGYRMQGVYCEL